MTTELKREYKSPFTDAERLWAALATILDQVDYTRGACGLTEMVGAVLPHETIQLARTLLDETNGRVHSPVAR